MHKGSTSRQEEKEEEEEEASGRVWPILHHTGAVFALTGTSWPWS